MYTSHVVVINIAESIGKWIMKSTVEYLQNRSYFNIMADESTDITTESSLLGGKQFSI